MKPPRMARWPAIAGALLALVTVTLAAVTPAGVSAAGGESDAASSGGEAPVTELGRHPGRGEQCLVCRQAIHGHEVVEVRYKGRTFHVAAMMLEEFEADPEAYFQELQARSALFDERAMEGRRTSKGWLWLGLWVLAGLACSALCGYLAVSRGLPPRTWFLAGLVVNVAAVAALLAAPRGDAADVPAGLAKVPTTHGPLPCPRCGAPNHPAAAACSACGARLSPAFEPETARV